MHKLFTSLFRDGVLSLLLPALLLIPLFGLHFHLPTAHSDQTPHTHQAETHLFHLHKSAHDNIDVEEAVDHANDGKEVNLDQDTRYTKLFQFLCCIALFFCLLIVLQLSGTQHHAHYFVSFKPRFEIFRNLLRGPPLT
ncbi:MAG: hypothetical protein OEZ39_14215 [Gammaproteobacteria bacterium]|nr:hypothetical protein [Gammaproteobacteria bacterium]MDH5653007.1 hypothetical protein [Gammaproteobacteria bacterium]